MHFSYYLSFHPFLMMITKLVSIWGNLDLGRFMGPPVIYIIFTLNIFLEAGSGWSIIVIIKWFIYPVKWPELHSVQLHKCEDSFVLVFFQPSSNKAQGTVVHSPQRMNPPDCDDPLTSRPSLAPPAGQSFDAKPRQDSLKTLVIPWLLLLRHHEDFSDSYWKYSQEIWLRHSCSQEDAPIRSFIHSICAILGIITNEICISLRCAFSFTWC